VYVAAVAARERRVPNWSPERIERLQGRRVRAIVAYAYQTVPFYRDAMHDLGLVPHDFRCAEDLTQLPVIDPGLVQDDRERFTSSLHGPGRRWAFHTSGSSAGLRRLVYWDNNSLLLKAARAERNRVVISRLAGERWLGTILRELVGERGTKIQRVLASAVGQSGEYRRVTIFPTDFSSRTERALWSEQTLIPRRAEHYELLSPKDSYERASELMNSVHPRVVFSYGSYADQFFRYLSDVDRPVAVPRVWVYVGDMVSPGTSELAARFGCQLYSTYASMEAGGIGFQCEHRRGFHLNVDLCAVRIANGDGRTLPAGQAGDVVISNLHNRAMVLLNFRIGDRGVLATDSCACGRGLPLLERLEGRRSDVVTLADGRRISSLSLEGLFRAELRHTRQLQIAQPGPGQLCWRVVPFTEVDRAELRRALVERGRDILGADTRLTVEFVDEIAKTAQGKFLRVVWE
jgi:phenylacetate-CoA ligase